MAFKQPRRRELKPNVRPVSPDKVVEAYEILSELAFDILVKRELKALEEEENGSSAA